MSPPRFELAVAVAPGDRHAVTRIARSAELHTFDRIVIAPGDDHDPLVAAGFAAAVTTELRIAATGVAAAAGTVAALGTAARTLDDLSGGRFALGLADADDELPLDTLRAGPAAALPLLHAGARRAVIERVARAGDGLVLPPHATAPDVGIARAMLQEGWRWHDRGGEPHLVAFAGLTPDDDDLGRRVAELADAGATIVAVAGVHGAADVERAAERLGLPDPRSAC